MVHIQRFIIFGMVWFLGIGFAVSSEPISFPLMALSDETGKPLPDALVYLPASHPSQSTENKPNESFIMDQHNKRFVPHVIAIKPGSTVSFPNSDDTRHHVYSFSVPKTFELKLYRSNDADPVIFEQPGIVTLGCNIHDNMKAYIYVTSAPKTAISNTNGHVQLDLSNDPWPKQIHIWHPQLEQPLIIDTPNPKQWKPSKVWRLSVPVKWVRPQEPKSPKKLERLLKKFAQDVQ